MTYLDPASNSGSKAQRLSDKNSKIVQEKPFLFPSATFAREITETLRKIKIRINDL